MIGPTFALFIRSLREDARTKFTPISRASLVLVILFFITVNQRNFAAQPAPGLTVFYMVMMVNLFGMVLGGITAFCSAITEEKEDDTLGLLRMTNLSPLAILFGKGISRLVSGALLIVAQLPFTILCVALGGVSATTIWKGYEVLLCTLFFLCNLGMLMSVLSRRTGMAVALAVLIGAVIYVGVPMYYFSGMARTFGAPGAAPDFAQQAAGYIAVNNPLYQLVMLLQGGGRGFFHVGESAGFQRSPRYRLLSSLVGLVWSFLLRQRGVRSRQKEREDRREVIAHPEARFVGDCVEGFLVSNRRPSRAHLPLYRLWSARVWLCKNDAFK